MEDENEIICETCNLILTLKHSLMSQLRFYFVFRCSSSSLSLSLPRFRSPSHSHLSWMAREFCCEHTTVKEEGAQSVSVSSLMFRSHVCQIKCDVLTQNTLRHRQFQSRGNSQLIELLRFFLHSCFAMRCLASHCFLPFRVHEADSCFAFINFHFSCIP